VIRPVTRRTLLRGAAAIGGLALAGCDRLSENHEVRNILDAAEDATMRSQRALLAGQPLAREYKPADISPTFRANGTYRPGDAAYARLAATRFADWRLGVGGLVRRPLSLSLAELKRLPARTQITRHDCVEGWSAIGQWTGVPLGLVLQAAGLEPRARYVVFHCADRLEQRTDGLGQYYESIDLIDAFHPQTILAYGMNGAALPIAHGAPLRLRVERQLGYKQAKYVMRIEAVDSLAPIGMGRGGFWEDRGYEWYAGT
jgi:DMSO/TMAO reductase YedYZ molybdopterin-dependent catalytic subunit